MARLISTRVQLDHAWQRANIWIADAHRDDGKRFVVHAEEKLTAFLELESAIRAGTANRYTSPHAY
jgi:hypothetical protein